MVCVLFPDRFRAKPVKCSKLVGMPISQPLVLYSRNRGTGWLLVPSPSTGVWHSHQVIMFFVTHLLLSKVNRFFMVGIVYRLFKGSPCGSGSVVLSVLAFRAPQSRNC
jgi:hypothetical protein